MPAEGFALWQALGQVAHTALPLQGGRVGENGARYAGHANYRHHNRGNQHQRNAAHHQARLFGHARVALALIVVIAVKSDAVVHRKANLQKADKHHKKRIYNEERRHIGAVQGHFHAVCKRHHHNAVQNQRQRPRPGIQRQKPFGAPAVQRVVKAKKESRKVEMRFCPACNQLKFARIIGVHTRRRGIGPVGCAGLRLAIIRRALRLAVRRHSSRRRGCAPGGRALAARRRAGGRVFCGAARLRRKGLRRRAFPFRLRRWLGLFGRLCARRLRLKLHAAVRAERGAVFHRFSAKWTLHHHTPPLKSKVS